MGLTSRETEPSEEQRRHLQRLGRGCRRFARLGRTPGSELGRFWPKATDLHEELAQVERELGALASAAGGYGATPAATPSATASSEFAGPAWPTAHPAGLGRPLAWP